MMEMQCILAYCEWWGSAILLLVDVHLNAELKVSQIRCSVRGECDERRSLVVLLCAMITKIAG
ncbi:MAG: hypothetical protein ACI9R3_004969 [Verrucomicrobiales bacterium]|jgi:hypothetical protein